MASRFPERHGNAGRPAIEAERPLDGDDEIQVQGFAAKDGTPNMWASSVILVSTGQRILQMTPPAVVKQ